MNIPILGASTPPPTPPPTPTPPVLKSGELAKFDSLFSGLVPVRIESIRNRYPEGKREEPSSDHHVVARVTRTTGTFKRGEIVSGWSLHFIPARALLKRQGQYRIGAYRVQTD